MASDKPSDLFDQRYAAPGYFYGTEPNEFLRAQSVRLSARSEILCLAEGEGRNAVFLAHQGHQVTAVDRSAVGLAKAARLAAEKNVRLATRVADLASYEPGTGTYDAVVSIFCHLPAAIRAPLHHRVRRALRPGGWFLLESYTPDQVGRGTGGPPDPALLAHAAELERELEGLEILIAEEKLREVVEGVGHTGLAAVVQLLARQPG
jgi:SAM-dependent methyltransferase